MNTMNNDTSDTQQQLIELKQSIQQCAEHIADTIAAKVYTTAYTMITERLILDAGANCSIDATDNSALYGCGTTLSEHMLKYVQSDSVHITAVNELRTLIEQRNNALIAVGQPIPKTDLNVEPATLSSTYTAPYFPTRFPAIPVQVPPPNIPLLAPTMPL
jgi:phage-related tail protein